MFTKQTERVCYINKNLETEANFALNTFHKFAVESIGNLNNDEPHPSFLGGINAFHWLKWSEWLIARYRDLLIENLWIKDLRNEWLGNTIEGG